MKKQIPFLSGLASAAALLLSPTLSAVVEWNGIQFGGFVSQGYLQNTGNNDYLGNTSDGTFDFREYAVSASYAKGDFRFGGQIFGQRLGIYGKDEIVVDWATIDYQPWSWLGLRAGRVKTPRGLYNEALDIDAVRPFVLLPQSVYDARLRDFNASFDGAMAFGNIDLGRIGSLDYKVYYGDIPMSTDSGASDYFNLHQAATNNKFGMDFARGGSLFWNTPISGLRVGYSYTYFDNFRTDRTWVYATPTYNYWKSTNYERQLFSLEYSFGDWIFAAEAGRDRAFYTVTFPFGDSYMVTEAHYAYASLSRRLNDRWEVGAYYSYSKDTQNAFPTDSGMWPDQEQNDYAISVRYDITPQWLIKGEVHYLDGSGKIFSTLDHPQPLADRDSSWMLFAVKTTFSF